MTAARITALLCFVFFFLLVRNRQGQSSQAPASGMGMAGTSTDFFVRMGPDFRGPGLAPACLICKAIFMTGNLSVESSTSTQWLQDTFNKIITAPWWVSPSSR
jgi:hypothetical protein